MHRLVLALAVPALISPAFAATSDDLAAAATAFIAEEVAEAPADRQQAIAACLVEAFDGLSDETVATMLAEDDFEDSLDLLIKAYPEREEHIETCEEL